MSDIQIRTVAERLSDGSYVYNVVIDNVVTLHAVSLYDAERLHEMFDPVMRQQWLARLLDYVSQWARLKRAMVPVAHVQFVQQRLSRCANVERLR